MCIATVYIDSNGVLTEVMRDVVRIETVDNRFLITDMFGGEQYIGGKLKSVDFWKEHAAIIEQSK